MQREKNCLAPAPAPANNLNRKTDRERYDNHSKHNSPDSVSNEEVRSIHKAILDKRKSRSYVRHTSRNCYRFDCHFFFFSFLCFIPFHPPYMNKVYGKYYNLPVPILQEIYHNHVFTTHGKVII